MSKRRVLIMVDWFYPGFKAGGPIQSCGNLVQALSDDCDFYIITSDRDFGDSQPYSNIILNSWQIMPNGSQIYYSSRRELRSKFYRLIKEVNPEVIYFNSLFSFTFTQIPLYIVLWSKFSSKLVLAPRGELQAGSLRLKRSKKIIFLKLFRLSGIPKKINFQATDKQERDDILKAFPNAGKVNIVGNIPSIVSDKPNTTFKRQGSVRLVFLSRVQEKKNILFFLDLLGNKKFEDKEILFDIYGNIEDDRYWKKIEEKINHLPKNVIVSYKGGLKHSNVLSTLSQYHFFVLTTFGENFGHSIFEALTAGTPVLLSNNTPWLNLCSQNAGWDIPLEDSNAFLDALSYMLEMKNEEFQKWSKSAQYLAQRYVEQNSFKRDYLELF